MINVNVINKTKSILAAYINSFRGLPKSVWEILSTHFVATVLSGTLYFLSYYFVHILKYDIQTATFFISCYGLGSIAGGLIGGKLTDVYSPRLVSIISLLLEGLAFFCFLKTGTKPLLIANMILFGVASYSFSTANYIWALNSCEKNETQKLKAINILTVISNLGLGFAAIFLGILKVINFETLFICYGLIFFILAGYLFLSTTDSKNKGIIKRQKKIDVKHAPNEMFIYLMLFSLFLIGMIISQMNSTYSLYIHANFPTYGLGGFSILFLINTFLVVTMQAPIGSLLSGQDNIKFVGFGSFLVGLGMMILSFATFFSEVVLAIIIYTIGEIIFFSLSLLVCYENSPPEKRGQWTGIYRMTFAVSRVIGPAAGGLIYYHYGPRVLWFFCFILGTATFLFCKFAQFKFPTPQPQNESVINNNF